MNKLFILLALLVNLTAFAENHEKVESQHEHGKHKLAIYTGFTHISDAFYEHETHQESVGKWVPTLGLDYFYSLNHKWEVGAITDVEFDNYLVKLDNDNVEERLNVVIASLVGKYKMGKGWSVFAGPGIEIEFSEITKDFFVFKSGIEYEVEITDGWELSPSFMYDWKEEYGSFAYGFSIGKRF